MKKIILSFIITCLIIILYNTTCYANYSLPSLQTLINDLGSDIEQRMEAATNGAEFEISGHTGLGYNSKTYTLTESSSIMSGYNTYSYCVSKGKGNLGQGYSGEYNMQGCIIINKSGVFVQNGISSNGMDFSDNKLTKYGWNSGLSAEGEKAAKLMYYILSADDKYGTNHNGYTASEDYRLSTECYDSDQVPFVVNTTERQYAIWENINDLVKDYLYGGSSIPSSMEYNKRGGILNGDCSLLEQAKQKYQKNEQMKESVYIWYLRAPASQWGEGYFYQDIIVAGKRVETNNTSGGGTEIPGGGSSTTDLITETTETTADFKIKKIDVESKNGIPKVTINLSTNNGSGDVFVTNNPETGSDGVITFTNQTLPCCFNVWENNPDTEYQQGDIWVGQIYIDKEGKCYWTHISGNVEGVGCEPGGVFVIKNKKKSNKGRIIIKKLMKEGNTEEPLKGVSFDLIQGNNHNLIGGDYSRYRTGTTGDDGTLTFSDLPFGTYTIRETSVNSVEGDILKKALKYNIGKTWVITINESNPNKVVKIENQAFGGFTIKKRDLDSNKLLQDDVTIKLKGKSTGVIKEYTIKKGILQSTLNIKNKTGNNIKDGNGNIMKTDYTLIPDTYEIYETDNNNKGYVLSWQGNYVNQFEGVYLGDITIEIGKITEKTLYNRKYGTIVIDKQGQEGETNLTGARFRIEGTTNRGKSYKVNITEDDYVSSSKLYTKTKVPYGTYDIYEVKAPTGYDLKNQEGYDKATKRVKLGTVTIGDTCSCNCDSSLKVIKLNDGTTRKPLVKDTNKSRDLANCSPGQGTQLGLKITNRKYINIQGYIWKDIDAPVKTQDYEIGTRNNLYDSSFENKCNSVYVYLYHKINGNYVLEERTTTGDEGDYKFENLNAYDLFNGNYYVEFNYSQYHGVARSKDEYLQGRQLYVPVIPTMDKTNSSKAMTEEVLNKIPYENGYNNTIKDDNIVFRK